MNSVDSGISLDLQDDPDIQSLDTIEAEVVSGLEIPKAISVRLFNGALEVSSRSIQEGSVERKVLNRCNSPDVASHDRIARH